MIERFLYVMIILVLAWVLFGSPDIEETPDPNCASNIAWSMSKSIVRQHLGYPLSVRFPDPFGPKSVDGVYFTYLGDCRHQIIAFADAFYQANVPTRREFIIEVSYHGQLGWRLDEIFVFDPRGSSPAP